MQRDERAWLLDMLVSAREALALIDRLEPLFPPGGMEDETWEDMR